MTPADSPKPGSDLKAAAQRKGSFGQQAAEPGPRGFRERRHGRNEVGDAQAKSLGMPYVRGVTEGHYPVLGRRLQREPAAEDGFLLGRGQVDEMKDVHEPTQWYRRRGRVVSATSAVQISRRHAWRLPRRRKG